MPPSPPFVEPSRKLKRQMCLWAIETRELVKQLETSGLVVNHGNSEDVPADVRERSSAIAGACIELTHGMLVIVGIVLGRELGDVP